MHRLRDERLTKLDSPNTSSHARSNHQQVKSTVVILERTAPLKCAETCCEKTNTEAHYQDYQLFQFPNGRWPILTR